MTRLIFPLKNMETGGRQMHNASSYDFLLMNLQINTSWSKEGEKLWLGIDVQGLASFSVVFFFAMLQIKVVT